jgi:hypothetical protein
MSLRGYEYKKGYWETKDHKIIKIKDMETSHIENTINFLKQRPDFYDEEYYCWGVDSDDMDYDYEDNSYLVDKKIEELELELRFRKLEEK